MNNELVELVAQLYEKNWGVRDYGLARAVVALIRPATLEEAADAVGEVGDCAEAAAYMNAIRALKDKA